MMKHLTIISIQLILSLSLLGQSSLFNFTPFDLPIDTFHNGSEGVENYYSQSFTFPVRYDTSFGYWASGFALSTMRDTADGTFSNLYSAYSTDQSLNNYAVANLGEGPVEFWADVPLDAETGFESIDITNTTYGFKSMRDGDAFAKQFGGPGGDDPDYFFIRFYSGDDSLDFYLADYRFVDNNEDYIIEDWTTVDLTGLEANGLSLRMELFSSDTGQFGINTPLFFAIDNIRYSISVGIDSKAASAPVIWSDGVQLRTANFDHGGIEIYDLHGRQLYANKSYDGTPIGISPMHQMLIVRSIKEGTVRSQKVWH